MELISVYIETTDFNKSINLYNQILQTEPIVYCENRWVEYDKGNRFSIYNKEYDEELLNKEINSTEKYNEAYINDFNTEILERKNNIITLDFYTEDLKNEYQRIKKLNIGTVSKIMYVNIVEPYCYFNITDSDGNLLEICSNKHEE